ncbi:MAG: hypothetical protein AAF317_17420 [Pseudomonadota bacterium]
MTANSLQGAGSLQMQATARGSGSPSSRARDFWADPGRKASLADLFELLWFRQTPEAGVHRAAPALGTGVPGGIRMSEAVSTGSGQHPDEALRVAPSSPARTQHLPGRTARSRQKSGHSPHATRPSLTGVQ